MESKTGAGRTPAPTSLENYKLWTIWRRTVVEHVIYQKDYISNIHDAVTRYISRCKWNRSWTTIENIVDKMNNVSNINNSIRICVHSYGMAVSANSIND